MANNKVASNNAVQTKPVEVSQQLQDGEKFIKWDEVSIEHNKQNTLAYFIQQLAYPRHNGPQACIFRSVFRFASFMQRPFKFVHRAVLVE